MWDFEVIGLPELNADFTAMEKTFDDPDRFLKMIAGDVGGDIKKNFTDGGRPETWPDITAKSRAQRKENKTSGPLIDTEALMNAASASQPGVSGSLFNIGAGTLTEGNDLVYGAVQEFGSEEKNIPARAYEQITDEDELRLTQTLESDYLHALLAGSSVL